MLWSLLLIALIGSGSGQSSQDCPGWETIRLNDKSSNQSSVYTDDGGLNYTAGRAFDGDLYTCSHTLERKCENMSWWRVDLLGLYEISCITINNKDHQNIDLTGARILVGNSSEGNFAECETITTTTRAENKTFKCVNGTKWGRYVAVYKESDGFVILCEVTIRGTKKGFKLIKENRTWEDALDHCREEHTDLASILDRETQSWVELEAQKAETPFVWLGLYYSCTLDLWFWVSDHCVGFNQWSPGEPRRAECDVSGAMSTSGNHFWDMKSVYDESNFICKV